MTNITSHYNWLTSCPASDVNFKLYLEQASAEDCRAALKSDLTKSARTAIERRLRKLERSTN